MANDQQERHVPGVFKKPNKKHNTGRHKSKGSLAKLQGGRVDPKTLAKQSRKEKQQPGKDARRKQAESIRKQKREDQINLKRNRGSDSTPPVLCAIVSLGNGTDANKLIELMKRFGEEDGAASVTSSKSGATHISVPQFKQRFAFICPSRTDLYAMLDAMKVADCVIFLVNPMNGVDQQGDYHLSCIFAHGLPTPVIVAQGMSAIPAKKQADAKKKVKKMLENRFDEKVLSCESCQEAKQLLFHVGSKKRRAIIMRETRPHIIAEETHFTLTDQQAGVGTLKLSGYMRGQTLSANHLVHLPGWGDYQMSQITKPGQDPHPLLKPRHKKNQADDEMVDVEEHLLQEADENQESLRSERDIDPLAGEQSHITEEEMQEAQESYTNKKGLKKTVPKGFSDYQASWCTEEGGEQDEESEDEDSDDDTKQQIIMKIMSDSEDDDYATKMSEDDEESSEEEEETEGSNGKTVTWGDDMKYDEDFDMEAEKEALVQYRQDKTREDAAEDVKFPDEIDTPIDVPARERFARYRGLKSFRQSEWNKRENLPEDYSRIFFLPNYKSAKKIALSELADRDGVEPGWYVSLHILNVPQEYMKEMEGKPMVAFGLLDHEQKMSVSNFVLTRRPGNEESIKAKENLIFHVGYRRFSAGPIYSEHVNNTKYKAERYFHPNTTIVATVYSPIMYTPATVMAFKEQPNGSHELVATGSLMSVNPDRLIVKRVVLSGHPFKINKHSCVIRFMFFNREDIEWFKAIELSTKRGLHGNIKEPLGTHGHMKCTFKNPVNSMDVVLMKLYKRVYPKRSYNPIVSSPSLYTPMEAEEEKDDMMQLFDD